MDGICGMHGKEEKSGRDFWTIVREEATWKNHEQMGG